MTQCGSKQLDICCFAFPEVWQVRIWKFVTERIAIIKMVRDKDVSKNGDRK